MEMLPVFSTMFLYSIPKRKRQQKRKQESPSAGYWRAGNCQLPLLDTFRTFKGNIAIENIKLNQLILQY